ncbi:MAG: nucleotidyltransferase domain-containing protein [Muribaculaceae bacterium]|nr:nucleotidyltransferase domain-containing protein [Muribaculaceae bacterium]
MINFPLKEIRSYLSSVPIDKAWLFGSFARGEETENSDIDLLVQFTQGAKLGLQYFHIINDLESLAKRRIDLVELSMLDPFVAPFVNKERILIYERTA